jgi:hypothetical protein
LEAEDSPVVKRDVYDDGDFETLPYDSQTLRFFKEMDYDHCEDVYHLKAVIRDAAGKEATQSGENDLVVNILDFQKPVNVTLTYEEDPDFFATTIYTQDPYLVARGTSPKSASCYCDISIADVLLTMVYE